MGIDPDYNISVSSAYSGIPASCLGASPVIEYKYIPIFIFMPCSKVKQYFFFCVCGIAVNKDDLR